MKKLPTRIFLLLCANIAALIVALSAAGMRLMPDEDAVPQTEEAASKNLPPLGIRPASVDDIQQSPLFSPLRQPAVEEKPVAETQAAPVADPPHVAGIVREGTVFRALLQDPSSNIRRLVKQGDEFSGWTLVSVRRKAVDLKAGDRLETLTLGVSHPSGEHMTNVDMQKKNDELEQHD